MTDRDWPVYTPKAPHASAWEASFAVAWGQEAFFAAAFARFFLSAMSFFVGGPGITAAFTVA